MTNEAMIWTAASAAVIGLAIWWQSKVLKVVVDENEAVFAIKNGRVKGPLAVGVHRYFSGDLKFRRFDVRATEMRVSGQEMLTRDRVSIKLTALLRYRVTDAELLMTNWSDAFEVLRTEAQLALRKVASLFELEELIDGRVGLNEQLVGDLAQRLKPLGMTLEDASVIDVMLAGQMKRAFADVALARAEGKAKLERARAETASLRSLANAARMMKENSGLLDLRTLEVAAKAAESMGNTLVLGVPNPGISDSLGGRRD